MMVVMLSTPLLRSERLSAEEPARPTLHRSHSLTRILTRTEVPHPSAIPFATAPSIKRRPKSEIITCPPRSRSVSDQERKFVKFDNSFGLLTEGRKTRKRSRSEALRVLIVDLCVSVKTKYQSANLRVQKGLSEKDS